MPRIEDVGDGRGADRNSLPWDQLTPTEQARWMLLDEFARSISSATTVAGAKAVAIMRVRQLLEIIYPSESAPNA